MRGEKRATIVRDADQMQKNPSTPIEIEFSSLQDNIRSLEENVQRLSDMLGPVLNQSVAIHPNSPEEDEGDRNLSPMTRRLIEARMRVYHLSCEVNGLIDRLEV